MSEETLKILVPVFTAILGLFVGYFLKKSEYERQRKDELEDRETNKGIKFRDSKIEEVQAYLNTIMDIRLSLIIYERLAIKDKKVDKTIIAEVNQVPEKLRSLEKAFGSFLALNDSLLTAINTLLISRVTDECVNTSDLAEKIQNNENVDAEAILNRVLEFETDTTTFIRVMQSQIHKLSQTLK